MTQWEALMELYDLCVHRGETLKRVLRFTKNKEVMDLTDWTAKSQVRTEPDGGDLICEIGVTIDAENGKMTLLVSDAVTTEFKSGVYAWDFRAADADGIARYYLGGKFRVLRSVTE